MTFLKDKLMCQFNGSPHALAINAEMFPSPLIIQCTQLRHMLLLYKTMQAEAALQVLGACHRHSMNQIPMTINNIEANFLKTHFSG
jgi:hypothetical protein